MVTQLLNLDPQGNLKVNSYTTAVYHTASQTYTDGTTNPIQADSHGALLVSQRDSSGAVQGSLGNPLRIDTTGTTTQPVSIAATVNTSSVPTTTGGLTATKLISLATTNATSVKASAGQVYNLQAFNTSTASKFVKLYNKAAAPTVGTDTPIAVYLVPANGSGVVVEISNGMAFSAGIAFAITGGAADSDTTAVAAGDVILNIQSK